MTEIYFDFYERSVWLKAAPDCDEHQPSPPSRNILILSEFNSNYAAIVPNDNRVKPGQWGDHRLTRPARPHQVSLYGVIKKQAPSPPLTAHT